MAQGRVIDFDERRGLGVIRDDGGTEYSFHCTQIADGSRTVAVGAPVNFEVAPGPGGQWEAAVIEAR